MSPLLRRYRAERLLRQEFEGLRGRVLTVVRGRLEISGVRLDPADLEACYAVAWQGLYAAMLTEERIDSPVGWLVVVTFRRAIDEHRSRWRTQRRGLGEGMRDEQDFAQEIDARDQVRHLLEALRGSLKPRECEAASLCYLQGLSRTQAAARMGISDSSMHKLMEGAGRGPGVAGKVGDLLETIRNGAWCEQQSSLMRGLAFGILDPNGERYRLAQIHRRDCPACRRYVLTLRGLAAVLPPMPLPWGLGLGSLAGAGSGMAGAGAGAGAGSGAAGTVAAGAGVQTGASAGTLVASGAAGLGGAGLGGAAGGSWLLAGGSVGAKLAAGCLMALSLGAGCVALTDGHAHHDSGSHRRQLDASSRARRAAGSGNAFAAVTSSSLGALPGGGTASTSALGGTGGPGARAAAAATVAAARQAGREFGPERTLAGGGSVSGTVSDSASASASARLGASASATARQASSSASNRDFSSGAESSFRGSRKTASGTSTSASTPTSRGSSDAQREFGVG